MLNFDPGMKTQAIAILKIRKQMIPLPLIVSI